MKRVKWMKSFLSFSLNVNMHCEQSKPKSLAYDAFFSFYFTFKNGVFLWSTLVINIAIKHTIQNVCVDKQNWATSFNPFIRLGNELIKLDQL